MPNIRGRVATYRELFPITRRTCLLGERIEGQEIDIVMPRRPTSVAIEPEQQRRLGVELFNYVWTLLEKIRMSAKPTG